MTNADTTNANTEQKQVKRLHCNCYELQWQINKKKSLTHKNQQTKCNNNNEEKYVDLQLHCTTTNWLAYWTRLLRPACGRLTVAATNCNTHTHAFHVTTFNVQNAYVGVPVCICGTSEDICADFSNPISNPRPNGSKFCSKVKIFVRRFVVRRFLLLLFSFLCYFGAQARRHTSFAKIVLSICSCVCVCVCVLCDLRRAFVPLCLVWLLCFVLLDQGLLCVCARRCCLAALNFALLFLVIYLV